MSHSHRFGSNRPGPERGPWQFVRVPEVLWTFEEEDMNVVACPNCTGIIEIEAGKGGVVECLDCGELWVLASEVPPRLVYALEMEDEDVFTEEEWPRSS